MSIYLLPLRGSSIPQTVQDNPSKPSIIIPKRYCASTARAYLVRIMKHVAATGEPIEIVRRGKRSVFLVRAADFENCLEGNHPWVSIRESSPTVEGYRPNGIRPGVHFAWRYRSSTLTRDRFCGSLRWVDVGGQPLLVTRRGKIAVMLLAERVFVAHWRLGLGAEPPPRPARVARTVTVAPPQRRRTPAAAAARIQMIKNRRRSFRKRKIIHPAGPTISHSPQGTTFSQNPNPNNP